MKVLLINSEPYHVEQKSAVPLGLLSIAAHLTKHGHSVRIYDRVVERGSLKEHYDAFRPDIAGVSALGVQSFPDAIRVSKWLKKRRVPVIWGGHVPSALPDIVLKTGAVDFVTVGEGEITMLELIEALERKAPLSGVDGLAYMENGTIKINNRRAFADPADLPVIDWSFVSLEKYFGKNVGCERAINVYSSKGCTGRCAYCYSPGYSGCVWRARPPAYYLNEIKYLIENHGADGVFFADDLLSPGREYLREFCENILESGMDFVWGCDLRADILSREELELLHKAGCRWIFFGIESGSPSRQKAIHKGANLQRVTEVMNWCKEIGIVTTTSFIIGFPGETVEELRETAHYMQNLHSDVKLAFFYYPIPGSEMYRDLVDAGDFTEPATWREWLKFPKLNRLGKNFSRVPDKELKVVSSWFLWLSIFGQYDNSKEQRGVYAEKAMKQSLEVFKRRTPGSVRIFFRAAKEFLGIAYYALLFPRIRKKYGLGQKPNELNNDQENAKPPERT